MNNNINSTSESIIKIKKNDYRNIVDKNVEQRYTIEVLKNLLVKNNNIEHSVPDKNNSDIYNYIKKSEKINSAQNNKEIKIKSDQTNSEITVDTEHVNTELEKTVQKSEVQKSETSLVSSIFKKKSKSDFEKKQDQNKNMSSKYSQSPSYSEPESIKRIKNTINVTETLRGGNTISSYSGSESESRSRSKSTSIEESSDWSDSSNITTINESSMYETLDDETITTMTDDDKKKTYKLLNKEMNYFKNIKKANKYDLRKYNFILNGLDLLNKYKK
jgi:hypothetical protein